MFGFGSSASAAPEPPAPVAPAADPMVIDVASKELEMVTDTYHKLVGSCYGKCINQPVIEGDVLKGEGVCVDRCVAKFFEVNKKIGLLMNAMGAAQAQQAGSMPV